MKILFHCSYPGYSGSQRMALQLAEELEKLGEKVYIAAPFESLYTDKANQLDIEVLLFPIPYQLHKFRGALVNNNLLNKVFNVFKLLPYYIKTYKVLKSKKIDVIYAGNERCLFFIGIAAKIAKIPVLWHVQSGFSKGTPNIHKLASFFASKIVCVSNAVANDINTILNKAYNIDVIYNGISDNGNTSIGNDFILPINITNHKILLFAGNLSPEKGLHVFLNALINVETNVKFKVIIAGEFKEKWFEEYIYYILSTSRKLQDIVNFIGYTNSLPSIMILSHIIVFPSIENDIIEYINLKKEIYWKEGFGLVVLEAMRASKPVIASGSYGLREVVVDKETGILVEPGSIEDLAKNIKYLLENEEKAIEFGINGRQRFLDGFSLKIMVKSFRKIFNEIKANVK